MAMSRLCFAALTALAAAAPGGLRFENKTEKAATGCDCWWIANDNCVNQDACAIQCRQTHGGPCAAGSTGGSAACDCSWISTDDCTKQDACAKACRKQHGGPCTTTQEDADACVSGCDASASSCKRWCHIPPGGGPFYTPQQEEALKGEIMECEGTCTVTRGQCHQHCQTP